MQYRLTFRVAEPEVLARCLPPLANSVTARRLGGTTSTARSAAGNPVLYAVVAPYGFATMAKPAFLLTFSPESRAYLVDPVSSVDTKTS
jgi:hypothetical protein